MANTAATLVGVGWGESNYTGFIYLVLKYGYKNIAPRDRSQIK